MQGDCESPLQKMLKIYRIYNKSGRTKFALTVVIICDQACKPSSVKSSHLSGRRVAAPLKPCFRRTPGKRISPVDVAPDRVCRAAESPPRRWALTSPFHPYLL